MASITVLLDTRTFRKSGIYPVVVRVSHKLQKRHIPTGYSIEENYWVGKSVSKKHPEAILINSKITEVIAMAEKYLADCRLHNKPIHLDLIGATRQSYSFTGYLTGRAKTYREKKKIVMGRKTERFVKELIECFGGDVYFEDINQDALRKFEQHTIDAGNNPTTRAKKFKRLSEFYTNAIDEGKAIAPNPFKSYFIQTFPVKKDKLSDSAIQAIENLRLKPGPVNNARNLFLFSYYCKGSRFENCVTLRKYEVSDGRVNIRMNKGKAYISVKIHSRLQAILDNYKNVPGDFVFPLVTTLPEDEEEYINLIGSLNTVVNRNLKIVAALAEISIPLTFHIARHTFAYHLKKKTNNINVIQDSLGHGDQKTTQMYLKALDDEQLDGELEKLYGD